jgi:hypothetical protein
MICSCAVHGDYRNALRVLVGKPEGEKPHGRPRNRCEGIRTDGKEIGWNGMNWLYLAQDRYKWWSNMNTGMDLCVS